MSRPLRVAVIGSGPSGIYAADALVSQEDIPVEVDIIDRLPVPFGLVRYGVAPDHLSIRSVRDTLDKVLDKPGVRFLGNIEVGEQVTIDDLQQHYDAVVLSYGASGDRRMGIPGEDLDGSIAATDFVAWYCGHPDADRAKFEDLIPRATGVVVVGVGNVAVDVTRVLAKKVSELDHTDMPQHVFDTLNRSQVTDIHVLGRRGPAHASFTTKELRELGELEDCDVIIDPAQMELDPSGAELVATDKAVARNVQVMTEWSQRTPEGKSRRIHMHFLARPVEITGSSSAESVVVERTRMTPDGKAEGTGETFEIPANVVVRSIGYRGVAIPGIPFDASANVIPHVDGRVLKDGEPMPGIYAAGWIKRGPTGIIGTNKKCAVSTVASLLEDAQAGVLPQPLNPTAQSMDDFLGQKGIEVVDTAGWRRINDAEQQLGSSRGRDRTTVHDREELLSSARA